LVQKKTKKKNFFGNFFSPGRGGVGAAIKPKILPAPLKAGGPAPPSPHCQGSRRAVLSFGKGGKKLKGKKEKEEEKKESKGFF